MTIGFPFIDPDPHRAQSQFRISIVGPYVIALHLLQYSQDIANWVFSQSEKLESQYMLSYRICIEK